MDQTVLIALVNNAALLLVLSLVGEISNWIPRRYDRFAPVVKGLLAALICLGIMSMPFTIKTGIIFDTRSILISVVALNFGFLPTAITVSAASFFRIYLGGSGMLPGLAVIFSSALIGLAWRRWFYPSTLKYRLPSLYIMGVVVHVVMLACMLLLPSPDAYIILQAISVPVIAVYPLVCVLLNLLLIRQQERGNFQHRLQESENKHRRLFETMTQGVVYQDASGSIISANPAAQRILGMTIEEMNGKTSLDPIWDSFREDGSKVLGEDHPSMIALRTGNPVGPVVMSVFQPKLNEHIWLSIYAVPLFESGKASPSQVYTTFQDITSERKANQNYELLFTTMMDAFALHEMIRDSDGKAVNYRFLSVNPAFESMTGLKAVDIIGKTVLDVMPEIEPSWIEIYGKVAATGNPVVFGNHSSVLNQYFLVSAYRPAPNRFACTFLDISERMAVQDALRESEAKYSSYVENAPDGILMTDEQGQIVDVNPSAVRISGYTREELSKMNARDIVQDTSFLAYANTFRPVKKREAATGELQYKHKDGSIRWAAVDTVPLSENRYLSFVSDITGKKEAEEHLVYLSNHDYLTGLYNRRYFEESILRLDVQKTLPLSVIIADINGLKLINDSFGQAQGDQIIADTARLISSCCRTGDVLARTGGDEFTLLLPRTGNRDADRILEKIKETCSVYNSDLSNEALHINLSLGFATKSIPGADFVEVCRLAEDQMNQRKLFEKKSSESSIIASIKATMLEKSHETEEHAERLSLLSRKVGAILELSQLELDHLELLATLHDIGKIGVSEQILTKPGPLDETEWTQMKKHTEIGYRIAMSAPNLATVADYILYHHERWDGTGYPRQLAGESIPLLSRILAVVDAYDAMTQDRPYRPAMTSHQAVEEIKCNAGLQFDPKIVNVFMDHLSEVL
jgi:diguanylate cyclase (GGDEF)-like protein/PAS domain S-box-containing protein